jgi:outer membrane protein TolC
MFFKPACGPLQALACALLAAALASPEAQAQSFSEALVAARGADAVYSAKLADVRTRRLQSRQASSAFLPSANVNYTQSGSSSNAVTLSQPLLSYDRYLQYQQSDPLALQADAEARVANNDLATRVFKAMAEIVRNREVIRATGVQIDGLETQYKRAQRMRELGQGTITEVSDFEVRLAVAQANRLSLRNALQAAQRSYTLITGLVPQAATLSVDGAAPPPDGRPLEELVDQVRRSEPAVVVAVQNLEIARLSSKRSWAQFLPTISLTAQRSQVAGANPVTSSGVGIVLNAPLGVNSYYEQQTASVALDRARENLRAVEETAVTELTNLVTSARSLDSEVRIRQRAVEAAQQAVEGNVKSYQGGVKSNIDVVTSYQNLAEAESALVNARLSQGETALRLQLLLVEVPVLSR